MDDGQFERLEGRLNNWGRWAFSAGGGRGHCLSVEHRYLPPKLAEGEQAAHRTPMPVDMLDAEVVEKAVTTLPCVTARRFLIKVYVYRSCPPAICRQFRLAVDLFEGFHYRNVMLVAQQLRAQQDESPLIRRGKPLWAGTCRLPIRSV